jgi:hypothetical protein
VIGCAKILCGSGHGHIDEFDIMYVERQRRFLAVLGQEAAVCVCALLDMGGTDTCINVMPYMKWLPSTQPAVPCDGLQQQ